MQRIEEVFGSYAFKTSKKSNTINTITVDILILYFGFLINTERYESVRRNRVFFIEQWFLLFQKDGRKIFKRKAQKTKIEAIENITAKIYSNQ